MIILGTLTLTDEDLAVIAHIVHNETPEEWATRAFNYPKGGEAAVRGKIARHRDSYLAAKDAPDYKTAAEKEADKRTSDQIHLDQMRADTRARKAAEESALDARIAAALARQIAAIPA